MHKFRDLFEISNDINVDNVQLLDVIGRVVSYQKPTFVPKLSTRRMGFRIANTYEWRQMTPDVSASQNTMIVEEFNDVYALFKNSSADVKLTELHEKNKYWVVDATIAQIETKEDLWYPSCRNCFKKMPRDPRNRRCFICGEENFSENFRTEKSTRVIPQEIIDSLVDRRVLFEVKCPANKVNKDVPQFTVSRVVVDEEIFEMYAANYTPSKGSTTKCKNVVNVVDNEVCSRLSKGKQKVDCEDELENETDIEDGTNQRDEKDIVDSEQNLEDEKEDCADDMSLKDLKEKKSSGYDAKCTSKNKKLKVKHDK
ncbi:hypothetical protein CASFOL_012315 [Castilleja foliolosa]|uniref:Replication factor A C-terminal domain-containing protein n=1 Tax=Castilleja foliolosa TaxID=1961234 RepID=A0ABD3DQ03_9LAMI